MGMFLRRGPAPHRTRASDLEIGQFIMLNLNNASWYWRVVNQGLPSSIYDTSCDGTWLLSNDIYENRQWHSSDVNDYANSTIHSYLNSTFLAMLDSNIQNAIKQVKLPYRAGSGDDKTVTSGANGLSAKIFLLSSTEVNLVTGREPTNEGTCLSYFSGTVHNGSDTKRVAYLSGSAAYWWLRSPYCNSGSGSQYALSVLASGNRSSSYCYNSRGIRPAIILPSDMIVTDDMLLPANIKTMTMIGSYFGYGYVMAGDTKYSRAGEVLVEIGTDIVAHVGAPDSTGVAGCKIYFNGTLVKTGTSSYSFTLKGNVKITFKRPDSSTSAIECYIEEQ